MKSGKDFVHNNFTTLRVDESTTLNVSSVSAGISKTIFNFYHQDGPTTLDVFYIFAAPRSFFFNFYYLGETAAVDVLFIFIAPRRLCFTPTSLYSYYLAGPTALDIFPIFVASRRLFFIFTTLFSYTLALYSRIVHSVRVLPWIIIPTQLITDSPNMTRNISSCRNISKLQTRAVTRYPLNQLGHRS